jgi:hypothetical protein
MALGGFSGQDPAPTLSQFQALVGDGQIHYLVSAGRRTAGPASGRTADASANRPPCGFGGFGGFGGGRGNRGTGAAIVTWVTQHFTAVTLGPDTVYDLTATPTPGRGT